MTARKNGPSPPLSSMRSSPFSDLRQFLAALEAQGQLLRVKRRLKTETEIHPLVRLQYRGLKESMRRAFLFENVTNAKGKKYHGSVAVGCLAGSERIYSIGMGCLPEDIEPKWRKALAGPLRPRIVRTGPVKEEIHKGSHLLEKGGLDEFPFPISTPGFDNAPYLTAGHFITKDPETGIQNVGNYRAQLKSQSRTGLFAAGGQDIVTHWEKCRRLGRDLEAAVAIGTVPVVSYCAVTKLPFGLDEHAVAGGLQGRPIELVKCETVDVEVPATAEIVLEGIIRTDYVEPEGPFGESSGYVDPRTLSFIFEITCITHRKNPIVVSILSQVTPSESSKVKHRGMESVTLDYLRKAGFKSVIRVAHVEPLTNLRPYVVVQMKKRNDKEPWRVMESIRKYRPEYGKLLVCVDEDIDPDDPMSVIWAMIHRSQFHKDAKIVPDRDAYGAVQIMKGLGKGEGYDDTEASLLIDATKKCEMPPISLPAKEHMENALRLWREMHLPELELRSPWYGYSLGYWPREFAEEARLALSGAHYHTGEKLHRRKVQLKPRQGLSAARSDWSKQQRRLER